jgi:hypothetical protein
VCVFPPRLPSTHPSRGAERPRERATFYMTPGVRCRAGGVGGFEATGGAMYPVTKRREDMQRGKSSQSTDLGRFLRLYERLTQLLQDATRPKS